MYDMLVPGDSESLKDKLTFNEQRKLFYFLK